MISVGFAFGYISYLVYIFQVLVRINVGTVHHNREMKVRTGCDTTGTNFCNSLSLCDTLTYGNESLGAVEIFSLYTIAVIQDYVMS